MCGIIAQRGEAEEPLLDVKDAAVDRAVRVAVAAADALEPAGQLTIVANRSSRSATDGAAAMSAAMVVAADT